MPAVLRKPSLSALQTPTLSPREAPRPRVGYTPSFDGVLNSGESWVARRRISETPTKPGGGSSQQDSISSGIREEKEEDSRTNSDHRIPEDSSIISSSSAQISADESRLYAAAATTGTESSLHSSSVVPISINGTVNLHKQGVDSKDIGPPPGLIDLAAVEWSYKDPTGQIQGTLSIFFYRSILNPMQDHFERISCKNGITMVTFRLISR